MYHVHFCLKITDVFLKLPTYRYFMFVLFQIIRISQCCTAKNNINDRLGLNYKGDNFKMSPQLQMKWSDEYYYCRNICFSDFPHRN